MNLLKILLSVLIVLSAQVSLHAAPPAYPYFPIYNGLQVGLDASYIDTSDATQVNQQNGATYVQSWKDYAGSNNATQTVLSKQPLYVPNGLNGLPVLQFNGYSTFLTTPLAQIKGDKSIFIVQKRTTTALATEIASTTAATGSGNCLADSWGGGSESEGRLNVAQDLQVPSSIGHFILKSYVLSGSTGTLTVNGTSTSGTVVDSADGNYTISNSVYPFPGQIAEVLIYSHAVTPAEQASIVAYLNDKWGLQDIPPPVVAGLQLRLAANSIDLSDPTQVVQQNGGFYVQNWRDSSGNNYQAAQSTLASQPLYVSNAVNGQPVVQFDGLNDYLTTTLPQISGDKSIFVVHRRFDTALRTEISSSTGTSGMFLAAGWGVPVETEGRLYVAGDMALPGYQNGYTLKSYIRSGGTATMMVNDTSTTAQIPDVASGTYTISGSDFPFCGQIAEVIIYNRALSETERQSIENYLSQKYGLWEVWLQNRTGLKLWLDAGVVDTVTSRPYPQVTSTGGNLYVNTWLDRSPYGNHATQAAAANKPTYWSGTATPKNAANGNPVISFTGTQFLTTPLQQISGDKSIFVVQRRRSLALGREISSTLSAGHALENVATHSAEAKGPVGGTPDLQEPGNFNNYVIKDFVRSGSTESLWVTNDTPATATVNDVAVGNYSISDATAPFTGEIGTALIYSRAVGTAERYSIEAYLANRWSYTPNNIYSVTPDLVVPSDTGTTTPAPGVCVKQTAPAYAGTAVYNTLYLPTDWQPGKTYPIIVEYAPNSGYSDSGFTTTGNVEDSALGYGISGGQGYIVIGMPCIGGSPLANQTQWWGTIASTEDYCLKEIQYVCQNYGGDPSAVFLAGFSRGAAACNFIGLYDSTIADTWLAFLPHSGYDMDGEYGSAYPNLAPAATRLARLSGRAQYVSQGSAIQGDWEVSAKYFLQASGINLSAFTFKTLPYGNHTGVWAERPVQLRRDVRSWMQQILATRPGTHAISGVVSDASGKPIVGALVQSGTTHFTRTDVNGAYVLASLIDSSRTVTVTSGSYTFTPQAVAVAGANLSNVNFRAGQ